ncbi:MAG: hypothetical protein R2813_03210 [Flavobacteriales bacterium]
MSTEINLNETMVNNGFVLRNMPAKSPVCKTVVITGLPRSGTSMIAQSVKHLGVAIGGPKQRAHLEDPRFQSLFEKNYDEAQAKRVIAIKNKNHEIWGWKRPMSFRYADKFAHLIRNPFYIIVFRDILATSIRKNLSGLTELDEAMIRVMKTNMELLKFALSLKEPVMLVSYEKAIVKPDVIVRGLDSFLNLNSPEELLMEAKKSINLDSGEYLKHTNHNKPRSSEV